MVESILSVIRDYKSARLSVGTDFYRRFGFDRLICLLVNRGVVNDGRCDDLLCLPYRLCALCPSASIMIGK